MNHQTPFAYLINKDWVTLDTETTGLGPEAEVCEISIQAPDGTFLLDTLVKFKGEMSPGAQRVHGITKEMCVNAPSWPEVRMKMQQVLRGKTVVIYNAKFDIGVMCQTTANWGVQCDGYFNATEYYCAMTEYARRARIYNALYRQNRNFKLSVAANLEGVALPETLHRSAADTDLTRRLILKILSEFTVSANEEHWTEQCGLTEFNENERTL